MAELTIDTYKPDYLPAMVASYNQQARGEPQIAELTVEMFEQLVAAKSYFNPAGLLVALRQGRPVGWVHACRTPGTESWQVEEQAWPRIRMLVFPGTDLILGRALVEAATRWLEATGGSAGTEAMHCDRGYPFYRGIFMGGEPMAPASLPHLHAALESCGYKPVHHSVMFLAQMSGRPEVAPVAAGLELRDAALLCRHEMQRQSWTGFEPRQAHVYQGETSVASIGYVVIPQMTRRVGAPVMSIWSLGVADSHKRRGLGSALVTFALRAAWDAGARSSTLATQAWNIPAHGTYQRAGFVPYVVLIGRTLAEKAVGAA